MFRCLLISVGAELIGALEGGCVVANCVVIVRIDLLWLQLLIALIRFEFEAKQ